jgi:hypothetical protein
VGSKGSSTTTSSFQLPKEFRDAYKKSIDMATQATSTPYQAYTGQLVAGFTPSQQQGLANINAAQGMALPAISQGMDLTRRAAQGITPELYEQFYSPYTRDVANTTMANLMESAGQQRSGLKSGAIQAGAFGGDRSGIAQAEMARQQNLALGQSMSNIYNQGYGQAMQLAGQQAQNYGAMGQQLAGLGVGAQGSVLQGAQAQMAAGAQQQATDQAQLQAAYEQWMQRQAYPYQQAQFFANIAQGLGAGAGGTSTTSTPGPSWGSQALGAIGAIGSIFSDERMKENIEAVGTLNDGQTIYRYNFKGDPKTQIGLLAQEVETRKPDAVTEVKGLKMVDYKDATENAASMGGVVTPDMQRQNFAEGGVSFYPYASRGYVPEGKIQSGGRGIPDAPAPFKDEGLAQDWKSMMPLSDEQVGGLKALVAKMGLSPSEESEVFKDLGELEYGADNGDYARGGVIGRHGYALAGSVEDDEAGLAGVPEPMADDTGEGLAAAEEAPRSRLNMGRLFASEENPSLIETIMGRRLSPAARSAVMNASFAMMAGRSPFMGVNIGEAGKVGAQTYYNALQQERELAKQKADIGRQGYEAETGRMGVEVQERNAQRQLAALILPIIRNYMALGQPVPPQYLRMINDAFPPGSPERDEVMGQLQPAPATQAPGLGEVTLDATPEVTGEEGAVPLEVPPPEGVESIAPEGEEASAEAPLADELRSIYDKLPNQQNPYYWEQRAQQAELAANAELANQYREKADEIRKADYERGYFNVPGEGRVLYPGKLEQQQAEETSKLQTAGNYEATSEQTKRAQANVQTFQVAKNTLDQAADTLARTPTGQFADTKTYFVTALNSLGLINDAKLIEQAKDTQELRKIFSQILFTGDLKSKIGSNIAASELEMFSRGYGDINLEPGANRFIVGTMRGLLDMEAKRAQDWIAFVDEAGDTPLSRKQIAKWEAEWNKENPAGNFVQASIAATPVAGEVDWTSFFSNPEYQRQAMSSMLKPGYQYVTADGSVKVFTGSREDRYFLSPEEYQEKYGG